MGWVKGRAYLTGGGIEKGLCLWFIEQGKKHGKEEKG
jgi:hypothetical protein